MGDIYVIVNISELDSIDYSQVSQSSSYTVRRDLDNTSFILSYIGEQPTTIYELELNNKLIIINDEKYFSHDIISEITLGGNWLDKKITLM